jgi:hypothetical protein
MTDIACQELADIIATIKSHLEDDFEEEPPKRCTLPPDGEIFRLSLDEHRAYVKLVLDLTVRIKTQADYYYQWNKERLEAREEMDAKERQEKFRDDK